MSDTSCSVSAPDTRLLASDFTNKEAAKNPGNTNMHIHTHRGRAISQWAQR
jgi:hypothetical protein